MKKSKFMSFLLALLLTAQLILPCAAVQEAEGSEESSVSEGTSESESTAAPTDSVPIPSGGKEGFAPLERPAEHNFPVDYQVQAKAAVLLELNSNTLLYGYEMDQKLYPASLTKVMTCMLALEYGNLDDVVTVSGTALENLSEYGSTANLQEGEMLPLRELLYCVMLSSANEGCNVVAEYVSGNVDDFVDLMNQKAQELGMSATHFANTHGLHDEAHYTTARDLATLCAWAWSNADFREIATETVHTVPETNLSEERNLHTTNFLTSTRITEKYYYSKASGIKTGFTTPAGGCLAATATDGELTFLSVVCGCETLIEADGGDLDMRFVETKRLFEFGFDNYDFVQVLSDTEMLGQPAVTNAAGRGNVVVHADANATVLLPKDYHPDDITISVSYDSTQTLQAPLEAGQRVGTVTAMYQDITVATANLVTLTAVESAKPQFEEISSATQETEPASDGKDEASGSLLLHYWYLTVPILLLIILLVILLIARAHNVRQARKRAERRRQRAARREHEDE